MMTSPKSLPTSILIADALASNGNLLYRTWMDAGRPSISLTTHSRNVSTQPRENCHALILLNIERSDMDGFHVMLRMKKTAGTDFLPDKDLVNKTKPEDVLVEVEHLHRRLAVSIRVGASCDGALITSETSFTSNANPKRYTQTC